MKMPPNNLTAWMPSRSLVPASLSLLERPKGFEPSTFSLGS